MHMNTAIEIRNLEKTYTNGVIALKGVSLDVEEGDFFALLGPNGAGKSTLIGIVSGLVNKSGGSVRIHGVSIDQDIAQAKLNVGVVPQEFNFGIFEKVIDIVVNQAGYYGIPRNKAMVSAEKYLRALGLWEKKNSVAKELSGGMKRRLMIARGLVHEPKLLILDEPTAGVDIELRRGMWDFLVDLNTKGVTIILTTHYLEEAEQLCRNVAIIQQGAIVTHGSIKHLLADMTEETIVVNLDHALSKLALLALEPFFPVSRDDDTLDLTISFGNSLNDAVQKLTELGYIIKSIRNKSNRLEEFFIRHTQNHES